MFSVYDTKFSQIKTPTQDLKLERNDIKLNYFLLCLYNSFSIQAVFTALSVPAPNIQQDSVRFHLSPFHIIESINHKYHAFLERWRSSVA